MRLFNVGKLFGSARGGIQPTARADDACCGGAAVDGVARAAMDSPLFESVLSFWCTRRASGSVPDWSVFHPADHPRLLPHIVLFEVIDGRFFARVVGDSVVSHLPMKLSNRFLDDGEPNATASLQVDIETARETGQPTYTERAQAWRLDHDCVGYQALSLPFRSESEAASRVLSVILFRMDPITG